MAFSGGSYTVSGDTGAALTLDNGSGNAAISATAGSHTISAQVATHTDSDLGVSVSGTGSLLNLSGGIDNTAGNGDADREPRRHAVAGRHQQRAATGLVNVTAGTVTVAAIDGAGDTTVTAAATLITAHVRQDTLTINAGSTVTINTAGGASGTSVVNFLQISDGTDFNWVPAAAALRRPARATLAASPTRCPSRPRGC